jgi:superfamily II RNA helicase
MVKICQSIYPISDEEKYFNYFEKYPFPLSSFQKFAIESIVEGHHILVTAHTGSGKTLPAEFAIEHFALKRKKVIYTSPIKALSNQKFYEFSQKFPHISFGILTGDIKTNPEADVLIMTTEILMNTLYAKNSCSINKNSLMFEMDFENELACVIFDEIHYINDPERGRVWEETIMMLPRHIQMVMLSATLDSPEKFALWCENRGENRGSKCNESNNKIVYLTTTYERVVPLTHYSFITCTQGLFKVLKNKELEMEIMRNTNTLHVLQDSRGNFNELNYQTIYKTLTIFQDKNHHVKRQHVLNSVAKHMVENAMLPAICFVLSRKALEQSAKEVTTVLLEDDSKVPYIVQRECEQIIRKLPNYEEYLMLPEYLNMVGLLEKGIAIHHAGVMPVLREMVELLFAKGYIKLLFATETFAVGINMPTKTVLFTDMNKFDGSNLRPLMSHEYTQMAGRAGRRGIDAVGHVIHLSNLFKNMDQLTLKIMMKGKPQTLVSKFKISYNLLLNLIDIGETTYNMYVKRSMVQNDIESSINYYRDEISALEQEINAMSLSLDCCKTPVNIIEEFIELTEKRVSVVNKKRKEIDRALTNITDNYRYVADDLEIVKDYKKKKNDLLILRDKLTNCEKALEHNIETVLNLLHNSEFILNTDNKYVLTMKGQIASKIRETHCLVFAPLIESGSLKQFTASELVGILSCFTNVSVSEDKKALIPTSQNTNIKSCIEKIHSMYNMQLQIELDNNINTGFDYSLHFDLIDYSVKWCECASDIECKQLLQEITLEKDIFLGEFIKAILKINNITAEMEKVAEMISDIEFLSVLKQVPFLTLKYIATNQSLYI